MIKGLAVEMGPYGVRANMLAPGFILTGMTSGDPQTEAVTERFAAITPLGRPGSQATSKVQPRIWRPMPRSSTPATS